MAQTNQTLVNFVQKLPIADKATALRSLIIYDTQNGNFDDLILSIASTLDFKQISPLMLIIEMASLNDGTQNVQRFVNDSCQYFNILIQFPDFFNQEYNGDKLFNEFVAYIHAHTSNIEFICQIIKFTINKDQSSVNFFIKVLNNFAYRFSQARLSHCLSELEIFYQILSINEIRYAFCQTDYFFQIMSVLFMKSIFPIEKKQCQQDFREYLGDESNPKSSNFDDLEKLLSSYYIQLGKIMFLLCLSKTCDIAFKFIREFFLDMKRRANDISCWMARYNFESTLMEILFLKGADWIRSDPFTPYMENSLAPIGSEYELSVVGKYSWVDPNNLTLDAMKISYEDNDKDIQDDQKAWEQKFSEVSNQKPNGLSNFFFATLQAIELSSVNFINIIENISRQINHAPNDPRNKILKNIIFTINILMHLRFKSSKVIEFLRGALKFLQITAQYDYNTKTLPSRPPIAYQRLPEYILASCAKLVNFYSMSNMIPAADNTLFEFIQMESSLFMNKKFVRNPVIANDIVKFFSNVASQQGGRGNFHLMITDTVIEEVYPAVVDFFSRVEKTGTSTEYYDKINMRRPCILLMTFWMKYRECRDYYIKHYKDKANVKFLYHLISDLSFYLDHCFSYVAQLIKFFGPDSNKSHLTIENDENEIRNEVEFYFSTSKEYYKLVSSIASFAPYAFDEENTAFMITSFAVSVFRKTADLENLSKYVDAKRILASIVSLISMLIKNQNILNKFADPSLGFDQEMCNNTMKNLEQISKDVCYQFQTFIEAKDSLDVLDLPEDIYNNDEFSYLFDPITGELLREPITLPSNNTYNKSTLEKLETMNDPYTQTPFTTKDLVINKEIQKAALEFFKKYAVPSKKLKNINQKH